MLGRRRYSVNVQTLERSNEVTAWPVLDPVDLDIVAALHIAPRASTTVLGEVLGISSSTANRRIARLQNDRLVRVVGRFAWELITSSNPYELWITSEPGRSNDVVDQLQQIPDLQMLAQTNGSHDIYANLYPLQGSYAEELLVERIPSIPGIRSLDSRLILETRKLGQQWRFPRLADDQVAALEQQAEVDRLPPLESLDELTDLEFQTLGLLGRDGRTSAAEVGRQLGVSSSTAARAIRMLFQTGAVTCRVETQSEIIGYPLWAFIALELEPSAIEGALETLSHHEAIRLLCTVTGDAPVTLSASFTGPASLASFLRTDLGNLPGIKSLSSATALRGVRRYWINRDGMRLGEQVQGILRR